MKNWSAFQYIVIGGLIVLIGLAWMSYKKEQKVSADLKANAKLSQSETADANKPITAQDFFNLIKSELTKTKSQVTVTT